MSEIMIMTKGEPHRLIYPRLLPIRLLGRLSAAGLKTTDDVHRAIIDGNLRNYKGIGQRTEANVILYYTEALNK